MSHAWQTLSTWTGLPSDNYQLFSMGGKVYAIGEAAAEFYVSDDGGCTFTGCGSTPWAGNLYAVLNAAPEGMPSQPYWDVSGNSFHCVAKQGPSDPVPMLCVLVCVSMEPVGDGSRAAVYRAYTSEDGATWNNRGISSFPDPELLEVIPALTGQGFGVNPAFGGGREGYSRLFSNANRLYLLGGFVRRVPTTSAEFDWSDPEQVTIGYSQRLASSDHGVTWFNDRVDYLDANALLDAAKAQTSAPFDENLTGETLYPLGPYKDAKHNGFVDDMGDLRLIPPAQAFYHREWQGFHVDAPASNSTVGPAMIEDYEAYLASAMGETYEGPYTGARREYKFVVRESHSDYTDAQSETSETMLLPTSIVPPYETAIPGWAIFSAPGFGITKTINIYRRPLPGAYEGWPVDDNGDYQFCFVKALDETEMALFLTNSAPTWNGIACGVMDEEVSSSVKDRSHLSDQTGDIPTRYKQTAYNPLFLKSHWLTVPLPSGSASFDEIQSPPYTLGGQIYESHIQPSTNVARKPRLWLNPVTDYETGPGGSAATYRDMGLLAQDRFVTSGEDGFDVPERYLGAGVFTIPLALRGHDSEGEKFVYPRADAPASVGQTILLNIVNGNAVYFWIDGAYPAQGTLPEDPDNTIEPPPPPIEPPPIVPPPEITLFPPLADFDGVPLKGYPPLTVRFLDMSINGPLAWVWDFGDGGSAEERDPTHVYDEAGLYDVALDVANFDGENAAIKTEFIEVLPLPPFHVKLSSGGLEVARFNYDENGGTTTTTTYDDDGNPTAGEQEKPFPMSIPEAVPDGSLCEIEFIPDTDSPFEFVRWTGDVAEGDDTTNPLTIALSSDMQIGCTYFRSA